MFDILDLPYQIEFSNSVISAASNYSDSPPDFDMNFEERRLQYAKLGLHAAEIADRIRLVAKQKPRPNTYEWDPIAKFSAEIERINEARRG